MIMAGLLCGSSKQHREQRRSGIYMNGTAIDAAVCAAQTGASFRQSSGTVSL